MNTRNTVSPKRVGFAASSIKATTRWPRSSLSDSKRNEVPKLDSPLTPGWSRPESSELFKSPHSSSVGVTPFFPNDKRRRQLALQEEYSDAWSSGAWPAIIPRSSESRSMVRSSSNGVNDKDEAITSRRVQKQTSPSRNKTKGREGIKSSRAAPRRLTTRRSPKRSPRRSPGRSPRR